MTRILAATAATAALLSACTQDTIIQGPSDIRSVTVTGEAEIAAAPDVALLDFSVTSRSANSGAAFTDASRKMNAVIEAVRGQGVEVRDLQTNQVSLSPVYGRDDAGRMDRSTIVAYEAFQSLTVRLRSIEKAGAVIDTAVGAGANGLNSFRMAIDDPKALRDAARVAAVKDAQAKAKAMAEAAGAELGEVMSLNSYDDVGGPRPVMARAMSAEAMDAAPNIQAGEQEVRVTVNATFRLK